jgi:CheY-like chemotaxis protein
LGYKILLADDSVTVQKIITLTFSDEGAEVSTVNNGEEAIARLRYVRPDLVMADVSIPGKDGYDICEFVKTHPDMKNTPVILLVPAFEPYDEERARRAGADHHLTKPFQSIRTLISTVKNLIESSGRSLGDQKEIPTTRNRNDRNPERRVFDARDLLGPTDAHNDDQTMSVEGGWLGGGAGGDVLILSNGEESAVASRRTAGEVKTVARDAFDEDLDHVLELDDVLADIWSEPGDRMIAKRDRAPVTEVTGVTEAAGFPALKPAAEGGVQSVSLALGQSTIDEIVNRVVENVLEKLPDLLSERLVDRLTNQVSEIIKRQQVASKGAYTEADSLLELDEL